MRRREFLQCAALLVAGASAAPSVWSMSGEQKKFLAARPNYIDRHPLAFFTQAQRATITAIAEQIIPATDTPGATDAGVPRFIELMVADWFDDAERQLFMTGLAMTIHRRQTGTLTIPATFLLQLLEYIAQTLTSSIRTTSPSSSCGAVRRTSMATLIPTSFLGTTATSLAAIRLT